MKHFNILLITLLWFVTHLTCAADTVHWPVQSLSVDELSRQYPAQVITVKHDPVYQKPKQYKAFRLQPVIRSLARAYPRVLDQAAVVFTAKDGYQSVMTYPDVIHHEGYLAFQDLTTKQGRWQPFRFGHQTITPAPFYLVWPNTQKQEKWRYAWPFQLTTIQLMPATQVYQGAAPASHDVSIVEGFSLFTRYCIRCHAINGTGGTVGPDLNTPVNPTRLYRSNVLRQRILNARTFNPETKMPVFQSLLSNQQVDKIIAYLNAISTDKSTF